MLSLRNGSRTPTSQGRGAASAKNSEARDDHSRSAWQPNSRSSSCDPGNGTNAELPDKLDSTSNGGSRGVRRLPGVPEVPEHEARPGQLKEAERQWVVMEQCLLAEGSGLATPGQKEVPPSSSLGMSKKQKQRLQHELHVMDTVAEIFNPERFSKRAARFRLKPGRAFDLVLGHDLTKLSNQQSIMDYIRHERPGLVIVSPPCNAFSSLNNLLQKFRQKNLHALKKYLKILDIGKRLLNFAMRVCDLCHSLQISFVFEQPQTARSWRERSVCRMLAKPGVCRVVADQCQFGLRSKACFAQETNWFHDQSQGTGRTTGQEVSRTTRA